MVSYTSERFKAAYGKSIYTLFPLLRLIPGKRDERVFVGMLFCLLGTYVPLFAVLTAASFAKVSAQLALTLKNREILEKGRF